MDVLWQKLVINLLFLVVMKLNIGDPVIMTGYYCQIIEMICIIDI